MRRVANTGWRRYCLPHLRRDRGGSHNYILRVLVNDRHSDDACHPTGPGPSLHKPSGIPTRLPSDRPMRKITTMLPQMQTGPVLRLGTLEGDEGACLRRRNSPG
jgi:hypothetical protein